MGVGKVHGRPVVISADDFTIRGGHADGGLASKSQYAEQLAIELKIPIVRLLDGSSGGGSVATYLQMGFTYVPMLLGYTDMIRGLSLVPTCSVVAGTAVGLGGARAVTAHFTVGAKSVASVFAAGPPIVIHATYEKVTKSELGGVEIHARNGTIDNVAESESDAFEQVKKFLSYLPPNALTLPSPIKTDDPSDRRDKSLLSAIPLRRQSTYAIRPIINAVVDLNSFFEIGAGWGSSIVTGFARMGGYPVGIISNDCQTPSGGTLDGFGAQKLRRHIDICETFGLPILQLIDQPGFAVGTEAERGASLRHGIAAMAALMQSTIPIFTVILKRTFGVAGAAQVDFRSPHIRVAWPSGDWGSLPLEGGVEAAYKRKLDQAGENREQVKAALLDQFEAVRNPLRTAEHFMIEEIISPDNTRPLVCAWTELVYTTVLPARLEEKRRQESGSRVGRLMYRP